MSISGGFSRVAGRARRLRCQTIQIFSRNPRQWKSGPIREEEVKIFKRDIEREEIYPVFVHMPYLPNIASSRQNLYSRSIRSVREDLIRGGSLGASYLVLHLGSRGNSNQNEAIGRIGEAINKVFEQVKSEVVLLLENTSGQGREVGYTFLQIRAIVDEVECKNRIGICLDTAHAFEAGYDLSKKKGLEEAVKEFDSLVGLERLHLLHLNDSRTSLGSRIDRHWHIGEGHIGISGFRRIVNHPQLSHLPAIMETPRRNDEDDLKNISIIRGLVGQKT